MQPATIANVYTLPADPAAALDEVLNDRDTYREYWERNLACLMDELLQVPGTEPARKLLCRAMAGAEVADLATADALRLLQAWVLKLGGVVDVAKPVELSDDAEG